LLFGILLVIIGFGAAPLFALGVILAFLGVAVHIMTPHHTHVPRSMTVSIGHACPECGGALTRVDEARRWYCSKERMYWQSFQTHE
jgi:hypothetical protein